MTIQKRIMLSAGEASGDMHGADLIKSLQQHQDYSFIFTGMGSQQLKNAGCSLLVDSAEIAVVGIIEVLSHWKQIQHALRALKEDIINNPPDLLILIDYPEFNLKLAAFAKQRGIKVLFYISPQIWAWRPKRIKKIGRVIDAMAVVFPFEVPLYEAENIPVKYVGHPLLHSAVASNTKQDTIDELGLNSKQKILGLFPGSRKSEIKRILPLLLDTAKQINQAYQDVQFVLPVAATLDKNLIKSYTDQYDLNIHLVEEQYYNLINICDSIITASGTATLEIALIGTPMIIVYRVSPLTYFIMSRLITVEHIGLANIVAQKRVLPEFIQKLACVKNIYFECTRQLYESDYNEAIREELKIVKDNLSNTRASISLDNYVIELLN